MSYRSLALPLLLNALAYACWFAGLTGWLPTLRLGSWSRIGCLAAGLLLAFPWALVMYRHIEAEPSREPDMRRFLRARRWLTGVGTALVALSALQSGLNPLVRLDAPALLGLGFFAVGLATSFAQARHIRAAEADP